MRRAIGIAAVAALVGAAGAGLACGSSSPDDGSGSDASAPRDGASDTATSAAPGVDSGSSGGKDAGSGHDAASIPDAVSGPDGGTAPSDAAPSFDAALAAWTLTWSDEFDGPDGSAVDPAKWTHDVGGNGWGNQEREYYTDGTQNAVVQGGDLIITATTAGASSQSCWYGACQYTSARLLTETTFSQQYGRFEARIQIPEGQGLWPAFWMLGSDIATMPWPACGEIDIMENIGKESSTNHGSLHAPGFPGVGLTGQTSLAGGAKLGDAFHTYAVEWAPMVVRFYVDDVLYETQTPAQVPAGGTWEFDASTFFLLLNVAVGGSFPGDPDGTTTFPQAMKVDWVRVYQPADGEP